MTSSLLLPGFLLLFLSSLSPVSAQSPVISPTAPPKFLLLVHQQIQSGHASERRKLAAAVSRACDRLTVPSSWIDLESITGPPEALSFDPFDSFAQIDDAFAAWPRLFVSHPALGRLQEQLDALVTSERTIITVRRDDLSFRPAAIDLSKMRFLRVLEVRLHPGGEGDFAEAFKILSAAYSKINATAPWVVYQVNSGMPSPTFFAFVPMHALEQNDDLLSWRQSLRDAEGEQGALRMQQIARDAYTFTQSDVYAVNPAMSHVTKDIIDGDPGFWLVNPAPPSSRLIREPPRDESTHHKKSGRSNP